ncbi:MAG: hypothetical protein ACRCVN_00265 [Spirochaetia bacterium]
MKKFEFRLENLLGYRRQLLDSAEKLLAIENQKCQHLIDEIQSCQDNARDSLMIYTTQRTQMGDLRQAEIYRQALKQRAESHKKELLIVEESKKVVQQRYIEQKRSHRAIELLKEKELNAYKLKKRRYTEKVLDDVLLANKYSEDF